jgi:hypothetical protein
MTLMLGLVPCSVVGKSLGLPILLKIGIQTAITRARPCRPLTDAPAVGHRCLPTIAPMAHPTLEGVLALEMSGSVAVVLLKLVTI